MNKKTTMLKRKSSLGFFSYLPDGKLITEKIRSSWSWWYGVLVFISSCLQWNIGSYVNNSAKIHL